MLWFSYAKLYLDQAVAVFHGVIVGNGAPAWNVEAEALGLYWSLHRASYNRNRSKESNVVEYFPNTVTYEKKYKIDCMPWIVL